MIRRILTALDGSPRAMAVLRTAAELAQPTSAEVILLRVIFIPAEFPAAAHALYTDPLRDQMIRDAENALGALASSLPDVAVAPPVVRHGQPWKVILAVAEELAADLIVMGSHGYHGIDRLLGTTAGKVANLARCNVLIVHEREPEASNPGAHSSSIGSAR